MKTVVGAISEQKRLTAVCSLVEIVTEFVVHRGEILGIDLETSFQPHIAHLVYIPGAGMTHHVTVARFRNKRPLPECLGQRSKPQRREEALAVVHQVRLRSVPSLQDGG